MVKSASNCRGQGTHLPRHSAINEDSGLKDNLIGMLAVVSQELTWLWSLPGMDGKPERLSWSESWHEAGDGRDEDHIVTNWSAVGG